MRSGSKTLLGKIIYNSQKTDTIIESKNPESSKPPRYYYFDDNSCEGQGKSVFHENDIVFFETKHDYSKGEKYLAPINVRKVSIYIPNDNLFSLIDKQEPGLFADKEKLYRDLKSLFTPKVYNDIYDKGYAWIPTGKYSKSGKEICAFVSRTNTGKRNWIVNRFKETDGAFDSYIDITYTYRIPKYSVQDDLLTYCNEFDSKFDDFTREIFKTINSRNSNRNDIVYLDFKNKCCDEQHAMRVFIPTGYKHRENQKELYLYLNKFNNKFIYKCVVFEDCPIEVLSCSDMLLSYADFDNLKGRIQDLANKAIDENWGKNNRVLLTFLKQTFAHEYKNNNIHETPDHVFSVFNTGLVEKEEFEPIYAIFKKKTTLSERHPLCITPSYDFYNWDIADKNNQTQGRRFDKVKYFETEEYVFNPDLRVELDDVHCIQRRTERIPLGFFTQSGSKDIDNIIIDHTINVDEKLQKINDILNGEADNKEMKTVLENLNDRLKRQIKRARLRAKYNWRSVVPCYNPEKQEAGFLMPLKLDITSEDSKMDTAAVITRIKDENKTEDFYQVHTVLKLGDAYQDARLVCSPEASWLNADDVFDSDD